MMDGNWGDHNSFSKFMLDWVQPVFVPSGSQELAIRALAENPDSVAIMPGLTNGSAPYAEYFMVENRYRTLNDTDWPTDGMLIWHVDATPDARGTDFLYNNSDTAHKLIRLMEADGLEEIETGDGWADAGDYYVAEKNFTPLSTPNSHSYIGDNTGIYVTNLSASAKSMTADFTIEGSSGLPLIRRNASVYAQTVNSGQNATSELLRVWVEGGTLSYTLATNASWVSVSPASGSSSGGTNSHSIQYNTAALAPGIYGATLSLSAGGAGNSPQTVAITITVQGTNIGQAVDATPWVWSGGGASAWFSQGSVTHDGIDAAQSGHLVNSQSNWIQTTVVGPGDVSFWWSVSSEAQYDYLRFFVDGVEQVGALAGEQPWQIINLSLASGSHALRWLYIKDNSVSSGADAGWVDQFTFVSNTLPVSLGVSATAITQTVFQGQIAAAGSFEVWNKGGGTSVYSIVDNAAWLSVSPTNGTSAGAHNSHLLNFDSAALTAGTYAATVTVSDPMATNSPRTLAVSLQVIGGNAALATALDGSNLVWFTGGNAVWFPQTTNTHDGVDAAQSGSITNGQVSWIRATVTGPGSLVFWWKVSSELNYDFVELYVNDELQLYASGETGWEGWILTLKAGTYDVRWQYIKDETESQGLDYAWLDEVQFTPGTGISVAEAIDAESYLWTLIGPSDWLGQSTTTHDGIDAAQSGPLTHNQTNSISVNVVGPGTLDFWWRTSSESNYDFLAFAVNYLVVTNRSGTSDWAHVSWPLSNGPNPLIWLYSKDYSESVGLDCGWVDQLNFTPSAASVGPAVDYLAWDWTAGGDAAWFLQTTNTHDGVDAVQNGPLDPGQQAWFEARTNGPGIVSFWWRCSSETNYDGLIFTIDGQAYSGLTGMTGWQQVQAGLPPGEHVFRWTYAKDSSVSVGSDAGWVDQIAWNSGTGDADGDGLPDWWEWYYGDNLTNLTSQLDRDGDRMSEVEEYAAGTDPTNRNSFLGMTLPGAVGNGWVLSWMSVSGKNYSLLKSTNLLQGFTWTQQNIGAHAPMNVYTDNATLGAGPYFYRIRLQ